MDADRWRLARELFDRFADLPPDQWRPQLTAACDGDVELEREVLALLAADAGIAATAAPLGRMARGLEAFASRVDDNGSDLRGLQLGPFRLLRQIGRGGMGAVWLAERADGEFAQQVAIKLVRSHWDEADLHARFRTERQMLADLRHPNIASLVDGGVTADGKPWLALEYVDGIDLCHYAEQQRLDLRQRLALFLTVCSAVTHAHAQLIVHRDLKPSNILVRGDGTVKLLDFGIAKLIDTPALQATVLRAFTPEYAAPEQIRGEAVTTSVDIYTLGLLLYELLTGRGPYPLDQPSPSAFERATLEQTPTRPSQAVTRNDGEATASVLAAQRRLTPQRLKRELRGDLDAIVLKALRKEPVQRYASVQDLAADLRAWLEHRPVAARRGGWRYGAQRFLRRHALAAAMATLAVIGLCAGLAVATWQAQQARLQRDVALAESAKSRAILEFMRGMFEIADPDESRGAQITARELLARGTERIRGQFSGQPAVRAELLGAMAGAQRGLGLYRDALPLAEEASLLARQSTDPMLAYAAELERSRVLHALGRYNEALALLEPLRQTPLPAALEKQGLHAEADFRRALALQAIGRLDEADRAYAAAWRSQLSLHGDVDRRTQDTAMRHVSLLVLRQQLPAAETLARTTLTAVRRNTDAGDPHRANAISTLAMVLANTGALSEAEALRREELGIRQQAQGATHPETIGAMNDLAAVQYVQHRYREAATTFRAVLAQRRALFGNAHPSVATVANNLAVCELELGALQQAEALAEEALRIRVAHYGLQHHTTAASLHTLGSIELALRHYADAERHLQQAVASYDAAMGREGRHALGALRDLARAQILAGHPDPDCAVAERAHALAQTDEPDAARSAYVSAVRAACWIATGRSEGAVTLAADLRTLREHWGNDDRRTQKIVALAEAVERGSR
ncbi:serine/threonine-protein kinase [Luteimonas cucumeris]|uniref:Serine/threonine-protein kinase n=1 Tax=Luteimonas cucumeris TaxID=985012 RepID=A0A562KVQ3_9GAMM|nr:serine/threonine-protein kinase [Luteimonas cucumeris]TWH99472.1 serine/threonine-protein kinase [Luteimonas cucumeris]